MNTTTFSRAHERDEEFFKKLNEFSQPLRDAAVELAEALKSLQPQDKSKEIEITELIRNLQDLQNIRIEDIELKLNNIRESFLGITNQISYFKPSSKVNVDRYLKATENFTNNAVLLVEKASELNSSFGKRLAHVVGGLLCAVGAVLAIGVAIGTGGVLARPFAEAAGAAIKLAGKCFSYAYHGKELAEHQDKEEKYRLGPR